MTLGEKIRATRLAKGKTQKEVGDSAGMADSAIRKYESGVQIPKIETLRRIAQALGVQIEELIYFSSEEVDEDYENLCDLLNRCSIGIEQTNFEDKFYVWMKDADDPDSTRSEYSYLNLLEIVRSIQADAEQRKDRYIKQRLEAELF